jgi:hypothetical protein
VQKAWAAIVIGGITMALSASSASAATTLGATQSSNTACAAPNLIDVQTAVAPGVNSFRVPFTGVITRWDHQARQISGALLKFKVVRATSALAGPASFASVGETGFADVSEARLYQFGIRIPVSAGDYIGVATASNAAASPPACYIGSPAPADEAYEGPDFSTGGTLAPFNTFRINIQATLEADADGDKYGDETQDSCPTDATVWTGPCPVPATAAKKCKKRKKKGKRHSATAAKKKKKKGCGRKK